MIYLQLFAEFLKIGLFSFGGAYSAIPLIRDCVTSTGWMSESGLSYMIAISESTPGPIMVNLATYVGNQQGGFFGALIATFAVVLPAFVIILLIMVMFKTLMSNKGFQATLAGVKGCVIGIVFATGAFMMLENCVAIGKGNAVDVRALIITGILAGVYFLPRVIWKKKISPIALIGIGAVAGIVVCSL